MIITYQVYHNNQSVGEIVQWRTRGGEIMWKALSFLPSRGGGFFNDRERAEKYLKELAGG